VPASVKARMPVRLKARARDIFGIEPWPDLAVRHALFRTRQYKLLREQARLFDIKRPNKPVLERGHQTSYVIARWFTEADVKTAFHVGYANGRHLFYLSQMGILCAGTDLPSEDTAWVAIPAGVFNHGTRSRLLQVDFFDLSTAQCLDMWGADGPPVIDVLFSEATFETMLPWRHGKASIPKYLAMAPDALGPLMHQRFPEKLEELKRCFRNMVFIEPEPTAGGTGAVFEACARRLPEFVHSIWTFRPPLDSLFRLSPHYPTKQTVYAFTRDAALIEALRMYAAPL